MRTSKSAVVLVLTMLVMTLFPSLTPMVKAEPTEITRLEPTFGFVGTLLKVEGTIDRPNGTYIIRWNQKLNITTGSASGMNVNTSFIVPPTIGAPEPTGRVILVELIDNFTQTVGTANFTLYTKFHIKADKPSPPNQLQEGQKTKFWLNVTGGEANTVYAANISVTDPSGKNYSSLVLLSNTTTTGYGKGNMTYPKDFGANAHTNNTGTYSVFFNRTLATDNFTIGLTDKLEYPVDETVLVQGSGYGSLEKVTVDIKLGGFSVATFPRNVSAYTDGVVTYIWLIPSDALPGIYNLTLTNATSPGTIKRPPDTQIFKVLGFNCQIQTQNLANQPVEGVTVKVYNATTNTYLNVTGTTNSSGWIRFTLESGNYTFKAFWKSVSVGNLSNIVVSQNIILPPFKLELTHIRIVVEDETQKGLSFIDLKFETKYDSPKTFRTNTTGTWEIYNVFTNLSYVVEARRYDLLLPGTPIQNRTLHSPWNNVTIIAPTYTVSVHVEDSKGDSVESLKVSAYEWSSGIGEPLRSNQTDSNGNVTLSLTFGRYRLILYNDTTFLNEATVDLIENKSFVVHSEVYNVDLSVLVIDYFGQPLPSVSVKLQRKSNSDYEMTHTKTTGSNGVAFFNRIIGGDCRVYVSVAGRPGETQYLYLVGPTKDVVFKMDGYVAFVGYALETSQFTTMILLLILIVAFLIASTYKRLGSFFQRRRK